MATLTIQPENTSTHIYEALPTTNYSETWVYVRPTTDKNARTLLVFDFSALPAGATITNATLSLYQYLNDTMAGRTLDACRLTQTGWVATQATWNIYSTDNNWTSAGGDFTTTDKASATVPVGVDTWVDFDVTTLAQWFQTNTSEVANL